MYVLFSEGFTPGEALTLFKIHFNPQSKTFG